MTLAVFDVNETLLDLGALDPLFTEVFGDPAVRREWFGQVLQSALVLSAIGAYQDFVAVAGGALDVVARRRRVDLTDGQREAIRAGMRSLPPHDDVVPCLDRLAAAGVRLAALTNSPQEAAEAQLASAGIAGRFERILSVSSVGRYKPAAAVYEMAAHELGVATSGMTMVAAHDWDVAGAMAAGCRGALVLRRGVVVNPLYPPPDIVGIGLEPVAAALEFLAEKAR